MHDSAQHAAKAMPGDTAAGSGHPALDRDQSTENILYAVIITITLAIHAAVDFTIIQIW